MKISLEFFKRSKNEEDRLTAEVWYAWRPVYAKATNELIWLENVLRKEEYNFICSDHGPIQYGTKFVYERWS